MSNIYSIGELVPKAGFRMRNHNAETKQVIISDASTANINPGNGMKIVGDADGKVIVDKITALTDVLYCVVEGSLNRDFPYNQSTATENNPVITGIKKDEVYLTAGVALAAGAKFQFNATGDKIVALTTGTNAGTVLQASLADEDVIKTSLNISNV